MIIKQHTVQKTCSKCKNVLPLSSFRKDKQKKDGLYPACNDCHRKRTGAKKMPDPSFSVCGYCGIRFRCRRVQIEALKGESLFCCRDHFIKNKNSKRKPGTRFSGYRKYIKERDSFMCFVCRSSESLHVHHIRTRGAGGTDDCRNLITLCFRCHTSKAHGMDSLKYMKIFLEYTSQKDIPEFWGEVMERSNKDTESQLKKSREKASARYHALKETSRYKDMVKEQKKRHQERDLEYQSKTSFKYNTYINKFKESHQGLTPSQWNYKIQRQIASNSQANTGLDRLMKGVADMRLSVGLRSTTKNKDSSGQKKQAKAKYRKELAAFKESHDGLSPYQVKYRQWKERNAMIKGQNT